jgi:hypothetical protein
VCYPADKERIPCSQRKEGFYSLPAYTSISYIRDIPLLRKILLSTATLSLLQYSRFSSTSYPIDSQRVVAENPSAENGNKNVILQNITKHNWDLEIGAVQMKEGPGDGLIRQRITDATGETEEPPPKNKVVG